MSASKWFGFVGLVCSVALIVGCGEQKPVPAAPKPVQKEAPVVKKAEAPKPAETVKPVEVVKPVAPAPQPAPTPKAEEHTVKLPCIADTHVATYQGGGEENEQTHSYGATTSLKIKHKENFPLMKFDLSSIPANATVTKASVFVHINKPDPNFFLNQISVCTVPTDWVEGKGDFKAGDHDEACLLWPGPRTAKWGWADDRDMLGSIFGNGGNVTSVARAIDKGEQWWEIPTTGRVVDAMRKDQPGGLMLQDEEVKRQGDYANIWLDSRENAGGKFAPYMTATYVVEDKTPPSQPTVISLEQGVSPGSVLMTIKCGGDEFGIGGEALGFDITATDDTGASKAVARYCTPRPEAAGSIMKGMVEGLQPGKSCVFTIVAYDEAGNKSTESKSMSVVSRTAQPKGFAAFKAIEVKTGGPVVVTPELSAYAVDELTRIDPVSGEVLTSGGYKAADVRSGNHIYNGKDKSIDIFGARGEIIGLNLVLEKSTAEPVQVEVTPGPLTNANGASIAPTAYRLYRVFYAKQGNRYYGEVTPPDPGPYTFQPKSPEMPDQKNQMVAVELYVPSDAEPGDYKGEIAVFMGGNKGTLPVNLKVYPAQIRDDISFIVELNVYGVDNKDYFNATHRLAHLNRLGYNIVPYSHQGRQTVPYTPKVEGEGKAAHVTDWSAWDDWMTPVLSGSLFDDMPRKGVPIPQCYLPFYENWPMPLHAHYTQKDVADRPASPQSPDWGKWCMDFARKAPLVEDAFDSVWVDGNKAVATEFRKHFEDNGWTRTEFQVFFNNKYYFDSGSVSYWTLDEPQCAHDFRAYDFVCKTFMAPFAGSKVDMVSRADVSRPQYQFDIMNKTPHLLINVSGGYNSYTPLIRRYNTVNDITSWMYGGGSGVAGDNVTIDAVILKSWCLGTVGCMPYWTSFSGDNTWTNGSDLRQVYFGNVYGYKVPVTGCLRMSAMRRGQLDAELMNLLSSKPGWDRWEVARTVLSNLNLAGKVKARNADDPGQASFDSVDAASLAALRKAVLEEMSQ